MTRWLRGFAVAWFASTAGCGGGSGICDAAELQLALDSAAPGDTVRIGACRIEGSVTVRPGVVLRGQSATRSTIAPTGNVTVCMEPGTPGSPTGLEDVTVEATNVAGIAVCAPPPPDMTRRAGGLALRRVAVTATRGWGVYVNAVDEILLEGTSIDGPLDDLDDAARSDAAFEVVVGEEPAVPGSCVTPPLGLCTPGETREMALESCPTCDRLRQVCDGCEQWATITAVEGLSLWNVGHVMASAVEVRGFASIGVSIVDLESVVDRSEVEWRGGLIARNMGAGFYAAGSQVTMSADDAASPVIEETYRAVFRPAYGAVVVDGTTLTTDGLVVRGNDGYGIVHIDSAARHTRLTATANSDAALWVGGATASGEGFTLEDSTLEDNMFAGVVVSYFAPPIVIRGTTITRTRILRRSVGAGAVIAAGDGLHMRYSVTEVQVERVRCIDNERAGILLGLSESDVFDGVRFSEVTVSGTGEQLGAIAARDDASGSGLMLIPPGEGGWDDGITREGSTAANDTAATLDGPPGTEPIVDAAAPADPPEPDDAAGIAGPEC